MRRVRILLTILIGLISATYLYYNWDLLSGLETVHWEAIAIIGLLTLVQFVLNGYSFAIIVGMVGPRLDALETIGLSFLTSFGNYLGPTRPGAAMKAVYLRVEKGLPFCQFGVVLAAYFLVIVFVSGVSGAALLALDQLLTGSSTLLLQLFCLALAGAALVLFLIPLPFVLRAGKLAAFVNRAREGFLAIRAQWPGLLVYVSLILAQYIVTAVVLMIAFSATGQPSLDFLSSLIIAVFIVISSFVTLTPNNIGIQEILAAYLYSLTGPQLDEGLLGLALIRAVHILLSFTLGPIVVLWMMHVKQRKLAMLRDLEQGASNATGTD